MKNQKTTTEVMKMITSLVWSQFRMILIKSMFVLKDAIIEEKQGGIRPADQLYLPLLGGTSGNMFFFAPNLEFKKDMIQTPDGRNIL